MRTAVCVLAVVLLVLTTGCPPPCEGADPRGYDIQYTLLSTTSPGTGTVRITGVAQNHGLSAFTASGILHLYEDYWGTWEEVASQEFGALDPGETVSVIYERSWSTSTEFPPSAYVIWIDYGPDGLPVAQDCNLSNNELSWSTSHIDDLF